MRRPGASGFTAVCHAAGARRTHGQTGQSAPAGVRRRVLLEMQWHDGGGRFHHVALDWIGVRRAIGAAGTVAMLAVAVAVSGIASVASSRAPASAGGLAVAGENDRLLERQAALRERALDLARQLHDRLGPGRCPSPPAMDAEDDVILAWLSLQGARLAALGHDQAADTLATVTSSAATPAQAGGFRMADLGSTDRRPAAVASR